MDEKYVGNTRQKKGYGSLEQQPATIPVRDFQPLLQKEEDTVVYKTVSPGKIPI